jgi:hypothetical protein
MQRIDVDWRRTNGQQGSYRPRFPANWGRLAQCDVRHMRFPIRLAGWKRTHWRDSKRSGDGARQLSTGFPIRLAGWKRTHWRDSKRSGDGARQLKNRGWLLEGWWHLTSIARFAERKTRPASRGSARGRTTVGPVRISRTRRICTIRYARPPRRNRRRR